MKFKKCNESGVDLSEYTDTETCPYCGSDEVDVDNPYIGNLYDGEEFTTECNCRTCGETWSIDWTANFKNREWAKVNESDEDSDNIEKEFTYKGVTITRYDYESLPSPMAATKCDDKTMQDIAKYIHFDLEAQGWSEDEIAKYCNNIDEYDFDEKESRIADKVKSDWWKSMEDVARSFGMEYWEDLDEYADEFN